MKSIKETIRGWNNRRLMAKKYKNKKLAAYFKRCILQTKRAHK